MLAVRSTSCESDEEFSQMSSARTLNLEQGVLIIIQDLSQGVGGGGGAGADGVDDKIIALIRIYIYIYIYIYI